MLLGSVRRVAPVATLVLALGTVAVLALVPIGGGTSCSSTDVGSEICAETSDTLLDTEGTSVLYVLLAPAALATIAVVHPTARTRRGVAIALTVCVVPAAMSIGVFYVPTLIVAWLAAMAPAASTR